MNFSNRFKIIWWACLLAILTGIGIWRICVKNFYTFDVILFIFWFALVLFPIISEISLFGVNIKKDLEDAKNDIKSHITEIKNHINYQPVINLNSVPVERGEYVKKIKDEIQEESKHIAEERGVGGISMTPSARERYTSVDEKTQERLNKLVGVEKLVNEVFAAKFGNDYKAQIKLEDRTTAQKIIADGIVTRDGKIEEIVEIKYITAKSFDNFYFIASRFIAKVFRIGLNARVRFVVVSESMDSSNAALIKEQANKMNYNRSINKNLPSVKVDFYKFKDDKLVEVKI